MFTGLVETIGTVERLDLTAAGRGLGEGGRGSRVNLERAVRAGDRLGGHLVQGHVDGVGTLTAIRPEGEGRRIRLLPPPELERYVVEKGSVALDGVSLTVATLDP